MKEFNSNDPLHGITLENIVAALVERHGWEELGRQIEIRCFNENPSVKPELRSWR
jgi:uncharacterized protein (DUF2132 family)